MHLQENTLYDLDLIVKVTQNVVQCPPNHMTYAPAKFEVATSNSLGEDGFTRKSTTVNVLKLRTLKNNYFFRCS